MLPEQNQSGQTMGLKGLRTRRKLIDATVKLLATTPIRDLKVVDIAEAANTSAATFYVYFDAVIDVVLAATAELSQSTPEIIAIVEAEWNERNSHDRAAAFVESYLAFWDAHRPLMRTRNFAAEEGDDRFTTLRERSILPLLAAMAGRIENAQAEGRITPVIFPYASAATILMMLERLGALAHLYGEGRRVPFSQMKEAAAFSVAAAFGWTAPGISQSSARAAAPAR